MTLLFQIIALFLMAATGYFWWSGLVDWAFAAFAIGVCSFFLGYRFQLKARVAERANAMPNEDDALS